MKCVVLALPTAHLCGLPVRVLPAEQCAQVVQGDHSCLACGGGLCRLLSERRNTERGEKEACIATQEKAQPEKARGKQKCQPIRE